MNWWNLPFLILTLCKPSKLISLFLSVHICDRGNNGGCDHVCNKDGDKAKCSCREGYELAEDANTCDKSKYSQNWLMRTVKQGKGNKNRGKIARSKIGSTKNDAIITLISDVWLKTEHWKMYSEGMFINQVYWLLRGPISMKIVN